MKIIYLSATALLMLGLWTGLALAQANVEKGKDRAQTNAQPKNNANRPQKTGNDEPQTKPINANVGLNGAGQPRNQIQSNRIEGQSPLSSSTTNPPLKNSDIEKDVNDLKERVAGIEKKGYVSEDDLGLFYWLPNPIVLGVIGLLIFLALILHLLHLVRTSGLNRDVEQLAVAQRNSANAARTRPGPGKNSGVEKFSEQLNQQGQGLNQLLNRVTQMEGRFTMSDSQVRDAVHAVVFTANWIGQAQLRQAFASDGGDISESDRASTIALLERYQEPLRLNASRVEPVARALAELVKSLEGRTHTPPEFLSRVQRLYDEIGRFDQWHKGLSDQLTSLRRGSFSQRSSMLQADQERLFDQVNNGSLSVVQMVQKSRALLEHYFPEGPTGATEETLALAERELNLKKIVGDAADYLMDWYNNLFQLQNQLGQAQRTSIEADAATGLARIQQIARDALGKFDVQPEAIQVGQTSYDRRLHDAALVRQAAQYPVNTIIEVHNCGFRRMSTGEVLRRPQVVVAGAAAS